VAAVVARQSAVPKGCCRVGTVRLVRIRMYKKVACPIFFLYACRPAPTACCTNCTASLRIWDNSSTIFVHGSAHFFAAVVQTTTSLVYLNDKNILGLSIGLRPSLGYNNNSPTVTCLPCQVAHD